MLEKYVGRIINFTHFDGVKSLYVQLTDMYGSATLLTEVLEKEGETK